MSTLRLHCYPHAGGGASAYLRWSKRLPPSIEVHRPQLPGRESRFTEPVPASLTALAESLAAGLGGDGAPFALFGHSFGAQLAFELARTLRRQGRPLPRVLAVSAATAPQKPDRGPFLHRLQGRALLDELRRLGASEEVLSSRELLEIFVPIIQGDSRLGGEHRYVEEAPLPCPILAYGGDADPTVHREELEAWSAQTSGAFRLRLFPGGHMYLHPGPEELFRHLAGDLLELAAKEG